MGLIEERRRLARAAAAARDALAGEVAGLRDCGMSAARIADALGVSRQAVYRLLDRHDASLPPPAAARVVGDGGGLIGRLLARRRDR